MARGKKATEDRRLSTIREQFGPRSQEYADAMDEEGVRLREAGEFREALELHRQVFELQEELRGSDSYDLVSAGLRLGRTFCESGDLESGLEVQERMLQVIDRRIGKNNQMAIEAMMIVAKTLHESKKYEELEGLSREIVSAAIQVYGADDSETQKHQSRLAEALRLRGNFEEAERLDRAVIETSRKCGYDFDFQFYIKNALVGDLASLGRLEEATDLIVEIVEESLALSAGDPMRKEVLQRLDLLTDDYRAFALAIPDRSEEYLKVLDRLKQGTPD